VRSIPSPPARRPQSTLYVTLTRWLLRRCAASRYLACSCFCATSQPKHRRAQNDVADARTTRIVTRLCFFPNRDLTVIANDRPRDSPSTASPMTSDLLILTAADVERVVSSIDARALLALMAGVFARLSAGAGDAHMPHRLSIPTGAHTALVMPARLAAHGTALKVVAVPTAAGDTRGLPASTLVLDDVTGAVRALVNARSLTALRTAAGPPPICRASAPVPG
jgi:hypothetical protein